MQYIYRIYTNHEQISYAMRSSKQSSFMLTSNRLPPKTKCPGWQYENLRGDHLNNNEPTNVTILRGRINLAGHCKYRMAAVILVYPCQHSELLSWRAAADKTSCILKPLISKSEWITKHHKMNSYWRDVGQNKNVRTFKLSSASWNIKIMSNWQNTEKFEKEAQLYHINCESRTLTAQLWVKYDSETQLKSEKK